MWQWCGQRPCWRPSPRQLTSLKGQPAESVTGESGQSAPGHLGSGGYGLLLGCVGIGAVAGAALMPKLRSRLTPGVPLGAGSFGLAATALVLGLVSVTVVVGVALVLGGLAWILALSTLNSLYQLTLPGWVKARGMSFYLIVLQGGNAVGSAVMGITGEHLGLSPTMLVAAAALALGLLAGLRYRFQAVPPEQLMPVGDWPQPLLVADEPPGGSGHGHRRVLAPTRTDQRSARRSRGNPVQPAAHGSEWLAGLAGLSRPELSPTGSRHSQANLVINRLVLERASHHRDVLVAEALFGDVVPFPSQRSENSEALRIGLAQGKMDILQGQGQRKLGRIVPLL